MLDCIRLELANLSIKGMLRFSALTTPRAFRQHDPLEDIIKGDIIIHDDSDVEVSSIDGPTPPRRDSDCNDSIDGSDSVYCRDSLGEYREAVKNLKTNFTPTVRARSTLLGCRCCRFGRAAA